VIPRQRSAIGSGKRLPLDLELNLLCRPLRLTDSQETCLESTS
jgi:hypothetical protein